MSDAPLINFFGSPGLGNPSMRAWGHRWRS